MENKIKTKIIHKIKRLLSRLINRPSIVVNARPIHRDIYLNSSAAIRIYLAMTDRPLHRYIHGDMAASITTEQHGQACFGSISLLHSDIDTTRGGASLSEKE